MKTTTKTLAILCAGLGIAAISTTAHAGGLHGYDGATIRADFDGDGTPETVVSSPQTDCSKGAVYVSDASGQVETWTRDTSGILGTATCYDYFGTSLAAGDLDDDGYDDLIIGAPGADDSGETNSGVIHVIYGSASGLTHIGDQRWHQDTYGIQGVGENYDYFGDALSVGDFDCNGYDDVAIGIPREGTGSTSDGGAVQVLYGSSSGLSNLDDVWYQGSNGVNGVSENGDKFGDALASGNFNGDTLSGYACDDLAIGAPGEDIGSISNAGYVYIIDSAGSSGLSTSGDQGFHQNTSGVTETAEASDQFGLALRVINLNGGIWEDLEVTVPGDACASGQGLGRHRFYGTASGISTAGDEVSCDTFECSISGGTYDCAEDSGEIVGSTSTETFNLLSGNDAVWTGAGADSISASHGNDVIFGGSGNDVIDAGHGHDVLIGGSGNDTFILDHDCKLAGKVIDGSSGTDTVQSHLTQAELLTAGVILQSVENYVLVTEDPDGLDDCREAQAIEGGWLQIIETEIPGSTCAAISYPCDEPDEASVYVDGIEAWSGTSEQGTILHAPCFDESAFGVGSHEIRVESTCNEIVTSDSKIAYFSNPGLNILDVDQPEMETNAGDTIVLDVTAQQAGLTLSADFSNVDSQYSAGAETVTDLGYGKYQISYTVSAGNTVGPGVYTTTINVTSPNGKTRENVEAATIRYTPTETSAVEFGQNTASQFTYGEFPALDPSQTAAITLSNIQITAPGSSQPSPLAEEGEHRLTGTIFSDNEVSEVTVNIREPGGGGYASVQVEVTGSSCTSGTTSCTSSFDVPLGLRPSKRATVGAGSCVNLEIGIYTGGGMFDGGSPPSPVPGPWCVPSVPGGTASINGRVTFTRIQQNSTVNVDEPRYPEYGIASKSNQTWPVQQTVIEIRDGCGNKYRTKTRDDGHYHRFVDLECQGDNQYDVWVQARADNGFLNVRTVEWNQFLNGNGSLHEDKLATFTGTNGSNEFLPASHYAETDNFYGALSTLQMGVRAQRWMKPFLVGNSPVSNMPLLTYRYNDTICPWTMETSRYSSGVVKVCSSNSWPNFDERDEHALGHETFHWFQDMFMPQLNGNGSALTEAGAFGEGFATMMPGVMTGKPWNFKEYGNLNESEHLEFSGHFKKDNGGAGDWVQALPVNLYVEVKDNGSGGWSWRILWDLFDGSGDFILNATRTNLLVDTNPPTDTYADFDQLGSEDYFRFIITQYLGGNHMPDHPVRPPIDDQGFLGLDMTEFLDGAMCKTQHSIQPKLELIVKDVMDFQAYVPEDAPLTCN